MIEWISLRAERAILSNLEIYTLALYTKETSQEWYSQMLRMIQWITYRPSRISTARLPSFLPLIPHSLVLDDTKCYLPCRI